MKELYKKLENEHNVEAAGNDTLLLFRNRASHLQPYEPLFPHEDVFLGPTGEVLTELIVHAVTSVYAIDAREVNLPNLDNSSYGEDLLDRIKEIQIKGATVYS